MAADCSNRYSRALRRATGAAALLLALAVAAPGGVLAGGAPLQAHIPGAEVPLADCLRVAVLSLTDRNGPLDPVDWVTVRVSNGCSEPVRHLLVDLLLQDVFGQVYGVRTWLLERGEVLMPGMSKTERYPVPDPAEHLPRTWAVRLKYVEKPSDRLRRQAPAVATGPTRNERAAALAAAAAAAAAAARQRPPRVQIPVRTPPPRVALPPAQGAPRRMPARPLPPNPIPPR